MLLLIEKYKLYKKEGLKPTKNILKFTQQYRETGDIYLKFLNECTQVSQTNIHTSELYIRFKAWYIENFKSQIKRKIG